MANQFPGFSGQFGYVFCNSVQYLERIWLVYDYFVGGLQNIPRQLYEAAAVDGVNVWQKFIFITLPSLKPILFFVSTMLLVNSFKAFDHIWVMTQGGPGNSTSVLMTYIYSRIYDSVGRASAASVILFVFVFVVTAVRNKLTGGESYGI